MSYIAGHHTVFFSQISGSGGQTYSYIGSSRDGIRHRERIHKQPVIDDSGGEAEVDAIQQGVDVSLDLDYIEYDVFQQAMYQDLSATSGGTTTVGSGTTGSQVKHGALKTNVGLRLTDLAGTLVLTPKPGTPAATEIGTGKSRIYYKAILVDDIEIPLASKLRQGPARFQCYPDATNSNKVWDIISTPAGVSGTTND